MYNLYKIITMLYHCGISFREYFEAVLSTTPNPDHYWQNKTQFVHLSLFHWDMDSNVTNRGLTCDNFEWNSGLWSSQFEMGGCNGNAFEFCMWKHQRICSNSQNSQSYEGSVILGSGQGTFWGWDASIRPIPSEVGDLIDGFPWSDHLQSFFKTKFNTITLNENYTQVTKTRQGGCRQNWLFSLHICPSYCAVSTERERWSAWFGINCPHLMDRSADMRIPKPAMQ